MLDIDTPDQSPAEDSSAAPATPPRRRRAASRPAGPPAVIEAAAAPLALPAVPMPFALEAAAEPVEEAVEEEAEPVDEVDADAAAETDEAEQAEEQAVPEEVIVEAVAEPAAPPARSRRRASRAAGPAEAPALLAGADDVALAEPTLPDPAPEAASEAADAPAPQRGRRRRPAARVAEPEASDAAATAEATESEPDAVAASLAALEESRPRRRSSRRKIVEEAPPADDVASALDSLAAAIASDTSDDADDIDDDNAAADAESEGDDDADGSDATPRRRRRRGGRRRRRGAGEHSADDSADDDDASDEEGDPATDDAEASESSDGPTVGAEGSSRRRRRRRRRGEDAGDEASEDGVDVVVRVREPRRTRASEPNDQITGIEGSTRMEAKKQRRREGRAAGRRRAPILSEAEFLARREAVDRRMVIRQRDNYTQIGVLEDGILVEHYVDRDSSASMIGNIYLGRVQNVLPSMEAAFVDIGRGRNAVIYAGEIDWDGFGVTGADRKVEKVLKSGQAVLVQVTKDPVGAKGARLTSHVSIPGRYVVYSPGGQLSGISRKLPENERARLKGILDELVGENASVIVRTAAEGASEDELVRDVNRLKAQWEVIEKKVAQGNSPQLLYSEPDLTVRIVRDLFTEDFAELVIDGNGQAEDAYETVQAYVTHVAPHLQERLVKWNRWTQGDLFEHHRVDEQVAKALERKVHLPSGGSLIIDRTEAMTVVDVNTGKFTGTQGNLEATVTSNNLEAAEEIVRQLRLRDIGGIIVIDFIDMVLPANRELLLRRLVECLGRDRTRHQVAEVTSLGLVQMTRKKIGTGLAEAFSVPCETCKGRGYHIHEAPVSTQAPADGGERDHHNGGRRRSHGSSGGSAD